MAAKDYAFFPAEVTGEIYLAKKIKNPHVMSSDRRLVTEGEITAMFEHYLRRFCNQHNGRTMTVAEGDKVIFEATLKDFPSPERQAHSDNRQPDICTVCKREFDYLKIESPVLKDKVWQKVIDHYDIPEPNRELGEHVFICSHCMEEALGREITQDDISAVPWNVGYRLHSFYNVDNQTVKQLLSIAKKYAKEDAPSITVDDFRRYVDFLNGLMSVFENPKLAGLITAIKNLKENDQ